MASNQIQKGQVLNPNGRPKGAVNKVTKDIKETIAKVVEGRLCELNDDLDSMSPFSKWQTLLSVMKYVYPTLSSQKLEATVNQDSKIEFVIRYENGLPPVKDKLIDI